jgi:hypothetical protein
VLENTAACLESPRVGGGGVGNQRRQWTERANPSHIHVHCARKHFGTRSPRWRDEARQRCHGADARAFVLARLSKAPTKRSHVTHVGRVGMDSGAAQRRPEHRGRPMVVVHPSTPYHGPAAINGCFYRHGVSWATFCVARIVAMRSAKPVVRCRYLRLTPDSLR